MCVGSWLIRTLILCACFPFLCVFVTGRGEAGPAWSDVPNGNGMQWGGANWGERVSWVHRHLLDSATKANLQVRPHTSHIHHQHVVMGWGLGWVKSTGMGGDVLWLGFLL